mgnify:CR=1 FL=1
MKWDGQTLSIIKERTQVTLVTHAAVTLVIHAAGCMQQQYAWRMALRAGLTTRKMRDPLPRARNRAHWQCFAPPLAAVGPSLPLDPLVPLHASQYHGFADRETHASASGEK